MASVALVHLSEAASPRVTLWEEPQLLHRPPSPPPHLPASSSRRKEKKPRREKRSAYEQREPLARWLAVGGGVSLLLIFVTFLPDELSSSLFGHRGRAPRSRQRGVFWKRRGENQQRLPGPGKPLPLYPALSVFPRAPTGELTHYYAFCFILLHRFGVI